MQTKDNQILDFVLDLIQERAMSPSETNEIIRKGFAPDALLKKIPFSLEEDALSSRELIKIIEKVIHYSLNTNHPYFMNQMFGKVQPVAHLADLLISVFNTSMYTYEVAPVFTLMEKEVIDQLSSKIWGEGIGDGVFTGGGSLSNMNALLLARQQYKNQLKHQGLYTEKPFAIFVSEQGHYSFMKGVNFLGFGLDSLIKVPTLANAKIDVTQLEKAIQKAKKEGRVPLMLIGIAGTTISGTFDPIDTLGQIAKKHNMWYHVDAAFGGSQLFSEKLAYKLNGIAQADSVGWNFHKVMGMPLSTTTLLTREKGVLNEAFSVDAGYLFHEEDYDYNLGQKSLRGGRRPDVFKLWLSWKYKGNVGFTNHVEKLQIVAESFANKVVANTDLELFTQPETSIVLFRYKPHNLSLKTVNKLNKHIRNRIFNEGNKIFNFSEINNTIYLRCVFLDPDISDQQLQLLIDDVVEKGEQLIGV